MEATSTSNKIGKSSPRDVLASRGGATLVAAIAAVLAGVLLYAFVQRYRNNQNAATANSTVFVAKSLIPKGSSADVIASEQLLQRTSVRGSQAQSGAVADTSALHGQVAAKTIYPGQQITASDFTTGGSTASQLSADQRAVAVPVDTAHGLVGYVHTGDYVDVLASYTGAGSALRAAVTTLMQNVLVMSAPTSSGGLGTSNSSNVLLRVSSKDAAALAYAADNGKVWIVLRPPLGGTESQAPTAAPTSGAH
jgi:Flp pilus assembly protein CpaB